MFTNTLACELPRKPSSDATILAAAVEFYWSTSGATIKDALIHAQSLVADANALRRRKGYTLLVAPSRDRVRHAIHAAECTSRFIEKFGEDATRRGSRLGHHLAQAHALGLIDLKKLIDRK